MKEKWLNLAKKKLTIIFTLLVFCIAVLLEWVFFSVKYYNYISVEEENFSMITGNVESKFTSISDFIINYDVWNRLFKMWRYNRFNIDKDYNENYVNLLIIDKEKQELVFSNVVSNLKLSFVEDILNNKNYWEIYQKWWYFIKKIKLVDWNVKYDVIFLKDLRYSFLDYLRDLLWFIWITTIFSVLFFYSWYKFVSKNLEPVEKNLSDMQDFIHNAWHELKTPISIVHSNLQLIKELKSYDAELINEWLNEISRLNHLIESLIELSNICSTDKKDDFEISNEIEVIIKDFKNDADKKDISIDFKSNISRKLTINRQYFYILFSNLLWNAIKYTNNWWKIEILLFNDKFIVKDDGIWISNDDIDKIFDRFYMWKKSRSSDWHWIWLSLVKKILDIFKWKIKVKSELWKGSEFIVFMKK